MCSRSAAVSSRKSNFDADSDFESKSESDFGPGNQNPSTRFDPATRDPTFRRRRIPDQLVTTGHESETD
jgi:hypothetical protein